MREFQMESAKRARELRKEPSTLEQRAWRILRAMPEQRFRRQVPIGPYVLDFFSPRFKMCVEIDGEAHLEVDRIRRDAVRDAYLASEGIRTLRFDADSLGLLEMNIQRECNTIVPKFGGGPPPPSRPGPA